MKDKAEEEIGMFDEKEDRVVSSKCQTEQSGKEEKKSHQGCLPMHVVWWLAS